MIKAIFFDMDGVLYDSMPNHERSWCKTFEAEGIAFPAREAYLNEGRTGSGTINLVFNRTKGRDATKEEIERIYSRKTKIMSQLPKAPTMPEMHELLTWLPAAGIEAWVVTGSKQPTLIEKLSHDFGIISDHIVSGADVTKGKPDAEPYLLALKRSGLKKDECAVVENAPLGVRSGKNAGLQVLAVNTGKLDDDDLRKEGPDLLFSDTHRLASHIRALITRQ